MNRRTLRISVRALASLLALAAAGAPTLAAAQPYGYGPPPGDVGPPQGEYAPPPPGAEGPGSTYDGDAQRYDRAYADRYSRWAARYCVDRRTNAAAGAAIGGVLGAVLGAGLSGRGSHAAGAFAGGALGAVAGGALGASSGNGPTCPPGYVVEPGAPPFAYPAPYPAEVVYGPSWYQPWVFVGGAWVYRPYRYWYWNHAPYWRPGWRPGYWRYHYRHW
jgi:hypothetical protein